MCLRPSVLLLLGWVCLSLSLRQSMAETRIAWDFPVAEQAGTQYELQVTTMREGRPDASTQIIEAIPVEQCRALAPEDETLIATSLCARLCLAPGPYRLRLRATRGGQWSPPSNDLVFDLDVQDVCLAPAPPPSSPPPQSTIPPAAALPLVLAPLVTDADGPTLTSLVNPGCVSWHIEGPCACGFPPQPCLRVAYYEPRYVIEATKKPGKTLVPILGSLLTSALSVTGMPAMGGGGATGGSGGSHTNLHYAEVHVYAMPNLFGGPCTACAPSGGLPTLHYASELDAVPWRTSTAPPLPRPALFPVGVWGTLFPRTGFVIHSSPVVASALQAVRALTIAWKPVAPPPVPDAHVVTMPAPGISTCMQLSFPQMRPCLDIGVPPPLFEVGAGSRRGEYVFVMWQKRSCCVRPEQSTCGITLPPLGSHGQNFCTLPPLPFP